MVLLHADGRRPDDPTHGGADGVDNCVRLRATPGTTGELLDCLQPGTRLESDGQTQEASGLLWRHVHFARRNLDGWIADRYLKPVP